MKGAPAQPTFASIQNSNNQEVRKEYFRTLAQVIEAENTLRHFVKVIYNDSDSNIKNS